MTVQDSDKFLVNRSNSSYQLEAQNLMAELKDDDLMLVNRDGQSYKATGLEIKDSLNPAKAPEIVEVDLAEQTPETSERFTSQKFDFTVACRPSGTIPMKFKAKAKVTGDLNKTLKTDEITGLESTAYSDGTASGNPSVTAGEANWANAFNGSLTGTPTACDDGLTYTLTLDNPIPVSGKTVEAYLGGEGGKKFIYCNGADSQKVGGSNNGGEWVALSVPSIGGNDINSISIVSTGSGTTQLFALRVAGEILIDGQTILTFDGDKDLAEFTAGDVVTQDSGYTANTSEIALVDETPTYSDDCSVVSGVDPNPSFPFTHMFDGDPTTLVDPPNNNFSSLYQ